MNTALTPTENHIAQTKPWKRKYQAYDLDKDRTIYFENPHGKAAKRLYKQYIDYGFEPEMVVPDDLQYYPLSGRFIFLLGPFFKLSCHTVCDNSIYWVFVIKFVHNDKSSKILPDSKYKQWSGDLRPSVFRGIYGYISTIWYIMIYHRSYITHRLT